MGHNVLVLFPLCYFWGVGAERREDNCFCTTAHPSGTLPEGVVGFASSYGASEQMLPAGCAKTCIWGEVGLLGSLTHPSQPCRWDFYQKQALLLLEKEEESLAKSSLVRWIFVEVSPG